MKIRVLLLLMFLLRLWDGRTVAQSAAIKSSWVDPATGLMWAARDSGRDLSWNGAVKYCRKSKLGGYSDWRLANMFELQGIYDAKANAPGMAGMQSDEPVNWHVKGDLFVTAYEWANVGMDFRGHPSGYQYYFDFNDGKSNDDPVGWPYHHSFRRALCVRGFGDPLGGQRVR